MSVIAINRAAPSLYERVSAQLQRLLLPESAQSRPNNDLKNLPDHLLLDIGIDPRHVPVSLDDVIARPDLAHGGVVTIAARTDAKS